MKLIDLTGRRFCRLVVTGPAQKHPSTHRSQWTAVCDCGKAIVVGGQTLRDGRTRSCGCLMREISGETIRRVNTTHGLSKRPTWNSWRSMMRRCYEPSARAYVRYGGAGITVYELWHKFENFLVDMGERPTGRTIDRINNSGNYEPNNCRWATTTEQGGNRHDTVFVTFEGETKCVAHWARSVGLAKGTLWRRLKGGWSIERALTTPTKRGTPA